MKKRVARVGEIIVYKEVEKWNKGDCILIEAQTGRGKTFFVKTTLWSKARMEKQKILMLSPRSALKRQNEKAFENDDSDIITLMNYQELEQKILKKKNDIGHYDYIVADECHYIYTDSNFNRCTDLTWEWLKNQDNSIRLFMSATIKLFEDCLKDKDKIIYKPYRLKVNYDYIENFYFYRNEDALKKMLFNLPEGDKAIYFAGTKKAYNMSKEFSDAEFYCSKNNRSYYKYANKDIEKEIDEEKDLSCKMLCTTNVLDSGVNIKDKAIKHIVVDIFDLDTIVQCVGRRRMDFELEDNQDKVSIYIKNQTAYALTTIYNSCAPKVNQGNYLLKNGSIAFAEKYKKQNFHNIIDETVVKGENGDERLELRLNEMMFIKNKNTLTKINAYRKNKNLYKDEIRRLFKRSRSDVKILEDVFDEITLEDKLKSLIGLYIVSADLKSPKADGIACPEIAGYNDHSIYITKGKTPPCASTPIDAHTRGVPNSTMVILSEYELVENPLLGVFR